MRLTTVVAAGLAAFLVSDVAAAQNLVANGDFHVGVASWTPGSMTLFEWNSGDWQGDPTSGSGRLTNVAPCASTSTWQCVVLPAPLARSYELGTAVYLEALPGAASAGIRAFAHEGAACQGLALGSFEGGTVNQGGTWVSLLNPAILLPPTTQSVTIFMVVTKLPFLPACTPPLPPASARFDHVRFGPTGTTPVTMQSFAVE